MKRELLTRAGGLTCMLLLSGNFVTPALGVGFVNGSFESPEVATFATGLPTGWGGVGIISINRNGSRGYGNAFSGSQYMFLPEQDVTAWITQTVNDLIPGVSYRFSLRLAAFNNTANPSSCYVRVGMDALPNPLVGAVISAPGGSTVMGSSTSPWILYSATFTATGPSADFEIRSFRSATDLAYAAVDDVRLEYAFNGVPVVRLANASKKPITVRKAKLSLAGTARSRIPIRAITLKVGSRKFTARGTSPWIGKVRLKRGTNRIKVSAVNEAGTASKPARLTVIRERK